MAGNLWNYVVEVGGKLFYFVDGTQNPGSEKVYLVAVQMEPNEAASIIQSWRALAAGRGDLSNYHATTRRKHLDERTHIVAK